MCNTTANQWFAADYSRNNPDPIKKIEGSAFWGSGCLDSPVPLNITCVVEVWVLVLGVLAEIMAPLSSNSRSILDLSLQQNGLSSLTLSYSGTPCLKSSYHRR